MKKIKSTDEMIKQCNEFILLANKLSDKIDLVGIQLNEMNELNKAYEENQNDNIRRNQQRD